MMRAPDVKHDAALQPANRALAAAALVLAFLFTTTGRGLTESFTVYLLPISASFGWDRAEIVSIYSLALLATGLSGPLVGRLFDRAGPRAVYGCGLVLAGSGFLAASYAQKLWHLQLSIGLGVGLGCACLGIVTGSVLISRWFGPRLPSAAAVVHSATGVGVLLLVPLSQTLIDHFGWRDSYRMTGIALLCLVIPILTIPWRRLAAGSPALHTPRTRDSGDDGWTLRRAIRESTFWGLFASFFFTGLGMTAISPQVVAYLVDAGFAPLQAATAWGFSGVLLVIGLIGVSWLDRLIGRMPTMFLMYALSSVGLLLLWLLHHYPTSWLLACFLITFGSSLGSRGPLITATAMHIFRGKHVGSIFGTIAIATGLGPALGSWTGGWIHDVTQSYDGVIAFAFVSIWFGMIPFIAVRVLRTL